MPSHAAGSVVPSPAWRSTSGVTHSDPPLPSPACQALQTFLFPIGFRWSAPIHIFSGAAGCLLLQPFACVVKAEPVFWRALQRWCSRAYQASACTAHQASMHACMRHESTRAQQGNGMHFLACMQRVLGIEHDWLCLCSQDHCGHRSCLLLARRSRTKSTPRDRSSTLCLSSRHHLIV